MGTPSIDHVLRRFASLPGDELRAPDARARGRRRRARRGGGDGAARPRAGRPVKGRDGLVGQGRRWRGAASAAVSRSLPAMGWGRMSGGVVLGGWSLGEEQIPPSLFSLYDRWALQINRGLG
jgi:hypothetical protein